VLAGECFYNTISDPVCLKQASDDQAGSKQICGDYSTNVIDYDYLPHARLRLRLRFANEQNNNIIDYDYIESNQHYNRDYICLETFSKRKQKPICKLSRKYIFRTYDLMECNKRNCQRVRFKYREKEKSHQLLSEIFVQTTNQLRNRSLS